MKRVFIVVLVIMTAAALAVAQAAPAAQKPAAPGAPTQAVPSQPAAPPAAPGQAAPAPGQAVAPAPVAGRGQPQAQSAEEYKAFQEAAAKNTPAELEAGADAFATQFPNSELRTLLYLRAMREYQNVNNADKTIAMGRKALGIDANNPEALVTVATVLSERTRETDLDREERLAEATRDAQKALQTVETDLIVPPNAPPDRVEAAKNAMRSMAYAAMGTVEMTKKNFPAAEANLKQAVQLPIAQPDPVAWLRLSVVLDQQRKYQEALDAANKAIQYSDDMPQANNLAKMERDRLQKLLGTAPAPATAPATIPEAATPPKPATPATPPPK